MNEELQHAAAQIALTRDIQEVSEKGHGAYGSAWNDTVNNLNVAGLNNADFVASVIDAFGRERASAIMHDVGQNLDRAFTIAKMSPVQRIVALARSNMESSAGNRQHDTSSVSHAVRSETRAAVQQHPPSQNVPKYHDSLSDEQFSEQFFDTLLKRRR